MQWCQAHLERCDLPLQLRLVQDSQDFVTFGALEMAPVDPLPGNTPELVTEMWTFPTKPWFLGEVNSSRMGLDGLLVYEWDNEGDT